MKPSPVRAHDLGVEESSMMPSSPLIKVMFHPSWVLAVLCFLSSSASAQICVPPPAGLVSWWPGDGNANDIADENHGSTNGDVTFVAGVVGQAFNFDGASWVTVPPHPTLNLAGEITIEFWFKQTATPITPHGVGLFGKRESIFDLANYMVNTTQLGIGLSYDDPDVVGGIDFEVFGAPFEAIRIRSSPQPPPFTVPNVGEFGHFAGTYTQIDPSHVELKMYVNGIEKRSDRLPGNLANTFVAAPVIIGGDVVMPGPDLGNSELFPGILDEVTLYNRTLSAEEIAAIFNAGSAGKCKEADGGVGGTVTGLRPALIVCENLTTQQTVVIGEQAPSWNCETAGLEVAPDDLIRITLVGGAN